MVLNILLQYHFNGCIDLKQIYYQLFLQNKWVYLGSAKNYNSGSATMASHMQVPCTAREGECFYRGEKEVGRAIVNKESMTFHWLSYCQERRGGLFSFLLSPYYLFFPLWFMFCDLFKKYLLHIKSQRYSPMFYSRNFIVLGLHLSL